LLITAAATLLLTAADLKAGALAFQSLTTLKFPEAVAALAVAIGAIWIFGSALGLKRVAGLGFAVVLVGLLATLIAIALQASGSPIPHVTLGVALQDHANLNQALVVNRLSDVKSLTPMSSPFLQLSMRNFIGLLLAVALGIVAAPHLLGRHVSQSAVAPGDAVRRAAAALAGVAIIVASLPPLAIYSRIGFEETMSKGIENAAIPQSLAEASALGWVKVCERNSDDKADLASACAKASGQHGFLRLQDLAFTTDGFVVAAPRILGLDRALQLPLLLGALLAAVLAGNALVAGLVTADTEVRAKGLPAGTGLDFRSLMLGAGLLTAAALVATTVTIGAALLAAEGFALLAAGIFPALVLGLHWRQMNASGAVVAMLVGTLVTAVYLVGVDIWPVELFRLSGTLSDAAPAAAKRFSDLMAAATSASDPVAQSAARAALARHVTAIANWGGLKPAAIVLIAVPAACLAGITVSLLSRAAKGAPVAA
jgi:Na+(H+)/acetate symporter ActP